MRQRTEMQLFSSLHDIGPEVMQQGAEGQAVPPGGGEVGDFHATVVLGDLAAPGQQGLAGVGLPSQDGAGDWAGLRKGAEVKIHIFFFFFFKQIITHCFCCQRQTGCAWHNGSNNIFMPTVAGMIYHPRSPNKTSATQLSSLDHSANHLLRWLLVLTLS